MTRNKALLVLSFLVFLGIIIFMLYMSRSGQNVSEKDIVSAFAKEGIKLQTPPDKYDEVSFYSTAPVEDVIKQLAAVDDKGERQEILTHWGKDIAKYGGSISCARASKKVDIDLRIAFAEGDNGYSREDNAARNTRCSYSRRSKTIEYQGHKYPSVDHTKAYKRAVARLEKKGGRGAWADKGWARWTTALIGK